LQPFAFDIVLICERRSNLKKTFYQAEINKAEKDTAFEDYYIDSIEDEYNQI